MRYSECNGSENKIEHRNLLITFQAIKQKLFILSIELPRGAYFIVLYNLHSLSAAVVKNVVKR